MWLHEILYPNSFFNFQFFKDPKQIMYGKKIFLHTYIEKQNNICVCRWGISHWPDLRCQMRAYDVQIRVWWSMMMKSAGNFSQARELEASSTSNREIYTNLRLICSGSFFWLLDNYASLKVVITFSQFLSQMPVYRGPLLT